jgi:tetratricopeptide (TPR) repeat protein
VRHGARVRLLQSTHVRDGCNVVVACSVLAFVTFAPIARARAEDEKTRARTAYLEAEKRYGAADYPGALELYREAYAAVPDPIFLFDIAQCHRLSGRDDLALFFYRAYLEASPDAPNRADAEALITTLEKTAVPVRGTLTRDGRIAPESGPSLMVPAAVPPAAPRGGPPIVAGLAVAAVGAVALGVSIWTGTAVAATNRYLDGPFDTVADYQDALARERRGRGLAWATRILVPVGGAAVVAGAALIALRLGRRSGGTVAVAPAAGGVLVLMSASWPAGRP